MRVFNKRTRIVEETLNIRFLENAPNVKGNILDWLFDIDSLTISMNYKQVVAGKQTNGIAGTKYNIVADESRVSNNGGQDDLVIRNSFERLLQQERQTEHINSTNSFNNVSSSVNTTRPSFANAASPSQINLAGTPATMKEEIDMNNVVSSYIIPDAPLTKFLKYHPKDQVIGGIKTLVQTRQMTMINEEHGLISLVQKLRRINHNDFQNSVFAYYLSQMEPKKPVQALKDPIWVEAMQDELLQFKLLKVWTLVDLPKDKWAIGTKWVFRNKKDERGIVVKNKARLVAQGHTQEEDFLNKVYKVEKALYGLHQAPRACKHSVEPNKALVNDAEAEDVDVHLHRSIIGSLMYLIASRPDITFVVCACARFQVIPKTSHLHAMKRIFRLMIAKDERCFVDKFEVKTDETVYKEWEDIMESAATTASSLEVEWDSDQLGVLSAAKILTDATRVHTYSRRRRTFSTGSGRVSTASRIICTAEETVSIDGVLMPVKDEWENIRARVKADEELTQRLQAKEKENYNEDDRTKMLVDLINQRKKFFTQQRAEAMRNKPMTQAQQRTYMDDLVQLWSLVKERFSLTELNDDKDRLLWVELKRLFEPNADDELWKLQRYMHDQKKWRLYDTCGVPHMSIKRGHVIFMLVEKDYPLTKVLMTVMLVNKL
nr:hypothetical protein [Tanacetum cinerariifolium]